MSTNPKSTDRGDQLFNSFVRTNEPPKPVDPPPGGDGNAPDPKPAPAAAPPAMWCSECRAPMRTQYYALNERPICTKCRPEFVKRIDRGTGPKAMQRAVLHGLATALVGAAVLGAAVTPFPFLRIFIVVGIGYAVGKRIMASVGGYGGRNYQLLAVGLTYFGIGLGSLAPAFQEEREAAARRKAIAADTTRKLATQGRAIHEELRALGIDPDAEEPVTATQEPNGDEPAGEGEEAATTEPPVVEKPKAPEKVNGPGLGTAVVLILVLPILAMLQFGLYAAGAGLFSLGYALYQAWRLTDGQGLVLQLSGPFRVGTGPIPPAM